MPLQLKAAKKFRSFDLSVSFRIGEERDRLRDALNVYSAQGRLETRHGRTRYNSTLLSGSPLSVTFFKNANGSRYVITKVGTTLYSVAQSGAHTALKTGLSSTTKHRGITWARGSSSRHIIAIEGDGLFQWDGTTFTQLGQAGPVAPTLASAAGFLTNGTYKVYLTYYSSSTGFESNAGTASSAVTTSSQGLSITSIPTTAANATIDKIRIYLKDTGNADDGVFVAEISLGTSSYTISNNPISTVTYPVTNAAPLSGGGKYLTEFNRKLVYAGNGTYRNDVFFSEEDFPDAFNDGTGEGRLVLSPIYDGSITGIAKGLYNNTVLEPYLVIFKERSIHVYSEIGGSENGKLVPISDQIGCVSHDTIKVKNGNIYFLSSSGWRVIENGRLVINQEGNAATLGLSDIDDIFTSPGYAYEVNKARMSDCFSVYYSTLDQYVTWVAEGAENDFSKAWVYEFKINGFKPYQFQSSATCACIGEDSSGLEAVIMADANGAFYVHSTSQPKADDDSTGTPQNISAFACMTWMDGGDFDSSYNFREIILRRIAGAGDLILRAWINYDINSIASENTFTNTQKGFVLDKASLDISSFGDDDRSILTGRADINRVGENVLIGFYQTGQGVTLGLIAAQLEFTKNGNRN